MTFLAVSKQVDAVITEDSDLIAFGCPRVSFLVLCLQFFNSQYISFNFFVYNLSYRKRSSCFIDASILNVTCVSYWLNFYGIQIIYKMDKFGQGVEFRQSMLQHNKELNLTGFTQKMFLEMCIISGCDYLQSLPGIGLKKSHALVKKFKSYDEVNIGVKARVKTSLIILHFYWFFMKFEIHYRYPISFLLIVK